MNSRERVLSAIEMTGPDVVPLYYSQSRHKSDVVLLPSGFAGIEAHGGSYDEWRCWWPKDDSIGMTQIQEHPLSSPDKLKDYQFPDPYRPGRADESKNLVQQYPDRFLIGTATGLTGLNRVISLCGFEQTLMHIAYQTSFLQELLEKVKEFEKSMIELAAGIGANGFIFADDWGTQQSLFIDPKTWRSIFKPIFREEFDHAHAHGLKIVLHSCGYIIDIVDDLIEIGVDVLNMEQLNLFGIDTIASRFGGRVCFLTNPDSQTTIPSGTAEQVRFEVEEIVTKLASPRGGLIGNAECTLSHKCIATGNVRVMTDAFERCRTMHSSPK